MKIATETCTRCRLARVWIPLEPLWAGAITCPHRKGQNIFERYAPKDAFSEFAKPCERFSSIGGHET